MHNSPTPRQHFSSQSVHWFTTGKGVQRWRKWFTVSLSSLTLSVVLHGAEVASAQGVTQEPPTALVEAIAQLDAAANQQDVSAVLTLYSPEFASADGLTYEDLDENLEALWMRFPNATYDTVINRWEAQDGGWLVETTTTITGTQSMDGRVFDLTATITSQQRLEGGQVVSQEILSEESRLTSGTNPPNVTVNLPEVVRPGERFSFDAIVEEPLGQRYLLGGAMEEPARPNAYLSPVPPNLELLNAGGLFKIGTAPTLPEDRWISAVLVREDGITIVTRRLRVEN